MNGQINIRPQLTSPGRLITIQGTFPFKAEYSNFTTFYLWGRTSYIYFKITACYYCYIFNRFLKIRFYFLQPACWDLGQAPFPVFIGKSLTCYDLLLPSCQYLGFKSCINNLKTRFVIQYHRFIKPLFYFWENKSSIHEVDTILDLASTTLFKYRSLQALP